MAKRKKIDPAIESQIAGPLSAALIAIAAISLPLISNVSHPENSWVDEILAIIGIVSLIGAARIIDNELDKIDVTIGSRFSAGGGGFVIFCLVIALLGVAILQLDGKRNGRNMPYITNGLSVLTGASIFLLLMTKRWSRVWVSLAVIAFIGFLSATKIHRAFGLLHDRTGAIVTVQL